MRPVDLTDLGLAGEDWSLKLDEIWRRYQKDRSPEAKEQYRILLKQLSDLTLRRDRLWPDEE